MDYQLLLHLCTELGYRLAMAGAETFRVEESINLIMGAYGLQAETFSIPNNLTVSIVTPEGIPMTRMKRIGNHGSNLDSVERYTNLSRRICAETPDPATAQQWLKETDASLARYNKLWIILGHCIAAAGYSLFFGGGFLDMIFAAICGMIVGMAGMYMDKLDANQFFKTIATSFLMALVAYALASAGIVKNADTVIIGTLMILVPGFLFTNAMRDIIYGDTNSGINRIVLVFLIAVAIALGTGAAWALISLVMSPPAVVAAIHHPFYIQLLGCFLGCIGFVIVFNIHGHGCSLCVLGGALTWSAYLLTIHFGGGDLTAYFFATVVAALYSEIMARVRKYPAISYQVISLFPLIPGASVYYTMQYALIGDKSAFADKGMDTIAIAGVIAVGVILVSTVFRLWSIRKSKKKAASV